MPPRRSHKKSRAGCRRCKARKIKCDEVHPRCGNCVRHGVPCDFEHPEIADSLAPADTPRPTTSNDGFVDSPAAASPMTINTVATTPSSAVATPLTTPHATPLTLYRNPEPMTTISKTSKNNRMMELKLLHHFTTITCKTLAIADDVSEDIWRDTVPNLAFKGAGFLADALLAVSALHLRSRTPHDQALVRASHAYMAATLSEYGTSLSNGINETNAEALFLTASLIAFQSTASRIFTRDDSGDLKERNDGYVLPLSWFHSFQGVKAVVASSWQWLRNSGIVIPIIEAQPALNLNLAEHQCTFFGDLLVGLDEELALCGEEESPGYLLTRQAYEHAVAVLNWAHKIPHTGAPLVFLATVSRRFLELLEARRPRALAILASYFALLKCLDTMWWLRGVARREVMGLVSLFDPDDEEWWPRLQWPLRVVLYEGDSVPPELWGADWSNSHALYQQTKTNGGFVTHIELLSKMFSAMQGMPAASVSRDPLDVATHAEAVFQERALQASRDMIALSQGLHVPQVD